MNNATLVKIADGVNDRADHSSGVFFRVDFFLAYLFVELSTGEVLKH